MGNGQYALLVSQPGEYQVDLELATQVRQSPDGRELTFECPAVALSTLDVTVPRADQAVDIKPQVVALPADGTGADVTHVRANVGSTQRITVTWRPRTGLTPAMDLLASANNRTLVTVADGLVHTDAWLTYDILRGELGALRILVPARQRILDLNADGRIRNWTVAEQNGNQVVTIELLNPAQKQLTVEIHTESRLEEAELTVAGLDSDGRTFGIHALDVVRESGQIAIRHSSDLVLTVAQQQGVVRIESAEVDRLLQVRQCAGLQVLFAATDAAADGATGRTANYRRPSGQFHLRRRRAANRERPALFRGTHGRLRVAAAASRGTAA